MCVLQGLSCAAEEAGMGCSTRAAGQAGSPCTPRGRGTPRRAPRDPGAAHKSVLVDFAPGAGFVSLLPVHQSAVPSEAKLWTQRLFGP